MWGNFKLIIPMAIAAGCAWAQTADPFANVVPAAAQAGSQDSEASWLHNFLHDNFGFREEIMSEFDSDLDGSGASRQSLGFELLKKFSTDNATIASFDFQGRVVRRDGYNAVPNDMEGAGHAGWAFEIHNLYLDLYHIAGSPGKLNFRIGHSYVPFGLSLQTDTHGTLLQLSNGNNFGFDQDWSAGFWGALDKRFNYDLYYLAGSGDSLKFKGQGGLGALRVSLADKYSSEHGIEGGISVIAGGRLAAPMVASDAMAASNAMAANFPGVVKTERVGIDGRYRHTAPKGLLTFTTELSGGRDGSIPVVTQLHQAEYLRASRRWGFGGQVRRFYQESRGENASIGGEVTWYFRNDVANSNVHWIKLNVERQLQNVAAPPHTIVTLQYYFYL